MSGYPLTPVSSSDPEDLGDTTLLDGHPTPSMSCYNSKPSVSSSSESLKQVPLAVIDTKSTSNTFGDWEPVLDISFSTSSIEPRSIVSYGFMGTLGQGSYGKVMLAYLKKRPDEGLYAVKMSRKSETVQYSKETPTGELDTLQMVANASSVRHINQDDIHGGRFLQRLADHFQDDMFNFIVLVRKLEQGCSEYS
jgi:hypothetical protein